MFPPLRRRDGRVECIYARCACRASLKFEIWFYASAGKPVWPDSDGGGWGGSGTCFGVSCKGNICMGEGGKHVRLIWCSQPSFFEIQFLHPR